MNFAENIAEAKSYAERALEILEERGYPPNPANFTIWYTHLSGKFPDLSEEVTRSESEEGGLTSEMSGQLFRKFFTQGEQEQALQDTGAKISQEMSEVLKILAEASGDAESFQSSLQSNLKDLTDDQGLDAITKAMKSLVGEAQKIQSSNADMQKRLEASSKEIMNLQENLDAVKKEALTDGLTGIGNRKTFDIAIERAIEEAKETGAPLTLAMTDIDFFKKFNDTYGHQTGDQVLKLVAKILDSNVREGETAARYGGEEFGLIMPGADLAEAAAICERVRTTVSSKQIRNRTTGESMGNITLSLGIALFRPEDTATDLLQRADAGLYYAKGAGRNQVVLETQIEDAALAS